MTSKPLISLDTSYGVGVIILWASGVLYSNQAGGNFCLQPEAEGVFVPLLNEVVDQEKLLREYFISPKGTSYNYPIDDKAADHIDHVLSLSTPTKFMKVDRTKYDESYEAWVHVKIAAQPDEQPAVFNTATGIGKTASGKILRDEDYPEVGAFFYPFYGFGECSGILTWCNSD